MFWKLCALFIFVYYPNFSENAVVSLTQKNVDTILANNQFVFVNFYTGWCRFSRILEPVFKEAAHQVALMYPEPGKVVFAMVNCDAEKNIKSKFGVNKYPTLKLFRDGRMTRKEYRGARNVDSILDYIRTLVEIKIESLSSLDEGSLLSNKVPALIGFFEKKDSLSHENFIKLASLLIDECKFYLIFRDSVSKSSSIGDDYIDKVYYKATDKKFDSYFPHSPANFTLLQEWATEKCIPLVREITFENAEELTEEGLNLMVLFRNKDDVKWINSYKKVAAELREFKNFFNFLEADCSSFNRPLYEAGKTVEDCPILALDSFRHLYLFPDVNDIRIPNRLKQFLSDFLSGKLHREFHYGPDVKPIAVKTVNMKESLLTTVLRKSIKSKQKKQIETHQYVFKIRESIFIKLKPSEHRYTFSKKDEL